MPSAAPPASSRARWCWATSSAAAPPPPSTASSARAPAPPPLISFSPAASAWFPCCAAPRLSPSPCPRPSPPIAPSLSTSTTSPTRSPPPPDLCLSRPLSPRGEGTEARISSPSILMYLNLYSIISGSGEVVLVRSRPCPSPPAPSLRRLPAPSHAIFRVAHALAANSSPHCQDRQHLLPLRQKRQRSLPLLPRDSPHLTMRTRLNCGSAPWITPHNIEKRQEWQCLWQGV